MAVIIDSSLHCFSFLVRQQLGGGTFSLSSLLRLRAFQQDFADRDLFLMASLGIAISPLAS